MTRVRDQREYLKAWRQKNKARIAEYQGANRERRRANHKASIARHAEKRAAKKADWHERNRTKVLARKRAWREAHPGWNVAADEKRRARKALATIGPIDYAEILRKGNGMCGICHQPLGSQRPHFDHIVPLSKGGSHTQDNLQASHQRCNLKKASKILAA